MDSQNYNSRSNVQPIVNQNLNTSSPAIQASVSISTGNGYGFILRLNQISFVSYIINLTFFFKANQFRSNIFEWVIKRVRYTAYNNTRYAN